MSLWWLLPAFVTIGAVAVLAQLLHQVGAEAARLRASAVRLVRVGVAVDDLRRQHEYLRGDLSRFNRQ